MSKRRFTGTRADTTVRLDESMAEMRAAYEAGATLREIGDRHGVSSSAVFYRLEALGVAMRRRGPRPKEDKGDE